MAPVLIKPPRPPPGWEPLNASDAELQHYLYDPRPDKAKAPHAYARWEEIAKRKPQSSQQEHVGSIEELTFDGLRESQGWAGAVLSKEAPAETDYFFVISGTFIVPQITPQIDHQDKYVDGSYRLWPWLGLGGLTNQTVLRSGLEIQLKVKHGKIVDLSYVPAILYVYGDKKKEFAVAIFEGVKVAPGDLIVTTVWKNKKRGPEGEGYARIYNEDGNQWAALGYKDISLEATSAQWIGAGAVPQDQPEYLLPNFDNVVFWNGYVWREDKEEEITIEDARVKEASALPLTAHISGNLVLIRHKTPFDSKSSTAED